jgi:hypothetical protein
MTAVWVALAPAVADAQCFTEPEWKAAHVRALQTDLQVAALECANVPDHSYTTEYNAFIGRFAPRLRANADLLKQHFTRAFGRRADRELDIFVTSLANDASAQSMHDMAYCANSADLFRRAGAMEIAALEQAALDHVGDHGRIGTLCPVREAKRTK